MKRSGRALATQKRGIVAVGHSLHTSGCCKKKFYTRVFHVSNRTRHLKPGFFGKFLKILEDQVLIFYLNFFFIIANFYFNYFPEFLLLSYISDDSAVKFRS